MSTTSRPLNVFALALLAFAAGCPSEPPTPVASAAADGADGGAAPAAAAPASGAALGRVKIKDGAGAELYTIKPKDDGAKLVDAQENELARLKVDASGKIKIKDAQDAVLGYVKPDGDKIKVKDASQEKTLFVLRRYPDGRVKLETGDDALVLKLKPKDYGYKVEGPDEAPRFKVKVKDGKTSVRDEAENTLLYTKDPIPPLAMAVLGMDELTREQRVALASAVARSW